MGDTCPPAVVMLRFDDFTQTLLEIVFIEKSAAARFDYNEVAAGLCGKSGKISFQGFSAGCVGKEQISTPDIDKCRFFTYFVDKSACGIDSSREKQRGITPPMQFADLQEVILLAKTSKQKSA